MVAGAGLLYRVRISSSVSGKLRSFSLYALPNPKEFYQVGFDKATLVPILVGIDFLGKDCCGMLIDFTTGLAMSSQEEPPEAVQLTQNRKGHFLLDVCEYLTRGHVSHEGHALVLSPQLMGYMRARIFTSLSSMLCTLT